MPQIAAAAEANELDFVLLTDHDTLEAKERGEEGWHGSVLVLVGEEVSPRRENHYLAFGLDGPIDHRGLSPQQIVDRVNEAGGFGFLSHPFSRARSGSAAAPAGCRGGTSTRSGYTGVELWSFVTDSGEKINSIADVVRSSRRPAASSTIPRATTSRPGTGSAPRADVSRSAASTPTRSESGSAAACRCG